MKTLFYFLLALSLPLISLAQNSANPVKNQMIKDWERAKAFTRDYLEAMPEDGYNYQPTTDVRTFAQQMLHIADANYGFTAAVAAKPAPMERGAAEKAAEEKSKEETIKVVMESYDFVINALQEMTDEQLMQTLEFAGQTMSKAVAMEKAFEHQTHHRGQTAIYLRLRGTEPPQMRLF